MNPEDNQFPDILLKFAQSFGDQVEGHARKSLTDEEKQSLGQFAEGEISPEKRAKMVALLSSNEEAIEHLASLLK
ncbi:hypothetical protein [Haloferula sp.]|uniref:hypothetical protein n=1 Tax=Haloferula sp. TaxID=2497595 RepID=UPI00329B6ED0